MATIKSTYRASADLPVTNLQSIATSSTWSAGWISGIIDNTSDLDLDKIITAKFALGNSATAGEIRVYAFAMLDDSNWPLLLSAGTPGTEETATITTTTIRDATMELLWGCSTRADPGTDDVYNMRATSLKSAFGFMPAKTVLYVSHSTGVNLAASGNQVTVKGYYETVA